MDGVAGLQPQIVLEPDPQPQESKSRQEAETEQVIADSLPDDWIPQVSHTTGETYYLNKEIGETQSGLSLTPSAVRGDSHRIQGTPHSASLRPTNTPPRARPTTQHAGSLSVKYKTKKRKYSKRKKTKIIKEN